MKWLKQKDLIDRIEKGEISDELLLNWGKGTQGFRAVLVAYRRRQKRKLWKFILVTAIIALISCLIPTIVYSIINHKITLHLSMVIAALPFVIICIVGDNLSKYPGYSADRNFLNDIEKLLFFLRHPDADAMFESIGSFKKMLTKRLTEHAYRALQNERSGSIKFALDYRTLFHEGFTIGGMFRLVDVPWDHYFKLAQAQIDREEAEKEEHKPEHDPDPQVHLVTGGNMRD